MPPRSKHAFHAGLATVTLLGAAPLLAGCDDAATSRDGAALGERLGGADIETLFAGKTVEGHHERHGYDFRSFYEADRFRSHQSDEDEPRGAKWWLDGDDICIRWDDAPEDLCRSMYLDEEGTYRKVKETARGPLIVVTFESFHPGNPDDL